MSIYRTHLIPPTLTTTSLGRYLKQAFRKAAFELLATAILQEPTRPVLKPTVRRMQP